MQNPLLATTLRLELPPSPLGIRPATMKITVEAMVGILGVVVALPPALLILWRCIKRRCRRRARRSSGGPAAQHDDDDDDLYDLQSTERRSLRRVDSLGTSVYVIFDEGGPNHHHTVTFTRTPSADTIPGTRP
ncbi:hypothetical protein F4779DRAFT_612635 [Xylariaceae sp. FL0662B]|nr:hypothetical protein F4779DRAFT_612635 [Xylariaceae sp. FL0662B]